MDNHGHELDQEDDCVDEEEDERHDMHGDLVGFTDGYLEGKDEHDPHDVDQQHYVEDCVAQRLELPLEFSVRHEAGLHGLQGGVEEARPELLLLVLVLHLLPWTVLYYDFRLAYRNLNCRKERCVEEEEEREEGGGEGGGRRRGRERSGRR